MKILTALVTSAMLAAGIAGSVAAYRTQAVAPDAVRPAAQAASRHVAASTHHKARPRVRWAPCPKGSTLEKGTCVTDVVRTVVLPAPAPTAPPVAAVPTVAASRPGAGGSAHAESADQNQGDDSHESDSHEGGDDGHETEHGD